MGEPAAGESLPGEADGEVGDGDAPGVNPGSDRMATNPGFTSGVVEATDTTGVEYGEDGLRKYQPGPVFATLKWISWIELGLFAGLMFVWLGPVHSDQWTFIFGMSHGIGFLILSAVVLIAVFRREAPYWLLAATLTPVGPVGSVIGIEAIERRQR